MEGGRIRGGGKEGAEEGMRVLQSVEVRGDRLSEGGKDGWIHADVLEGRMDGFS